MDLSNRLIATYRSNFLLRLDIIISHSILKWVPLVLHDSLKFFGATNKDKVIEFLKFYAFKCKFREWLWLSCEFCIYVWNPISNMKSEADKVSISYHVICAFFFWNVIVSFLFYHVPFFWAFSLSWLILYVLIDWYIVG